MPIFPRTNYNIPNTIPDRTLIINVTRSFGNGLQRADSNVHLTLEECVRGFWTIQNLRQARYEECNWVAAYCQGTICGIWKVDEWLPMTNEFIDELHRNNQVDARRWGCTFRDDDDETVAIRREIIGTEVYIRWWPQTTMRGYFRD